MIYYTLLIVTIGLSVVLKLEMNLTLKGLWLKYSNQSVYIFSICLFLTLIAGLRHSRIGLDTIQYKDMFEFISQNKLGYIARTSSIEGGYLIYNKIISSIGGSFQFFLLISAAIYVYSIGFLIKKFSLVYWLSFILFIAFGFYSLTLNEIRQSLAVALTSLSFFFIVRRKIYYFLLIILISALFHKTSIIFIPAYWIFNLNVSTKHIVLMLLMGLIVWQIAEILKPFLLAFSRITYSEVATGGKNMLLFQIGTLIVCLIFKDYVFDSSSYDKFFFFMLAYTTLLFPICNFNPTFFRLQYYSFIFMILLIPNVLQKIPNKVIKYAGMVIYVLISLWYASNYTIINARQIIPYAFFWQ